MTAQLQMSHSLWRQFQMGVPACFSPSQQAIDLIAQDLAALQDELDSAGYNAMVEAAASELVRRIGGIRNLASYVSCLVAQADRKAARAA